MKTPEEIKQSIRICAILDENHDCTTCPRFPDEYTDCSNALLMDALAYIEQLEERIAKRDRLLAALGVSIWEGDQHENT